MQAVSVLGSSYGAAFLLVAAIGWVAAEQAPELLNDNARAIIPGCTAMR